ncbi:hypothetical protein TYRP_004285 [Tyrophagus putrescentiae]|nr:hypothetical protein TYRP_004285 [Tyrophagus putrescentiae]
MASRLKMLLALVTVVILSYGSAEATADLVLQKCLPKADMENIVIKCNVHEIIAFKAAFFTSSAVDQCPFANSNRSEEEGERDDSNAIKSTSLMKAKSSCTDDLRMTLNSRCSGRSNCTVNLRKVHTDRCPGFDGWINIKYTCVSHKKLVQYCNIDLSGSSGYVTNPGYPKFYPPYLLGYDCTDQLAIIEENAKVVQLCGDVKSNLIEYRSKSDHLVIEFVSFDFSPSRGVLFKYSLLNCPTLKAPSNGYMIRNGSLAYYWCVQDQVFESDGEPNLVLFCEQDTYWNGSVPRCVPKENVTAPAYALMHQGKVSTAVAESHSAPEKYVVKRTNMLRSLLTPVSFLIFIVLLLVIIIVSLFALRKKTATLTAV